MNIQDAAAAAMNAFNDVGYSIVYFNMLSLFGIDDMHFPFIIFLILSGALFFTIKLKFVNVMQIGNGIKMILTSGDPAHAPKPSADGKATQQISPIKALFSVIAGAAGLGNIVGVTVAITAAGPGAAFWMILVPFITMPVRFAEVCIGHKYRVKNEDGSFSGGPFYYMEKGLSEVGLPKIGKILALAYAILFLVSGFGGGCSFQTNQVVKIFTNEFTFLHGKDVLVSLVFVTPVILVMAGGIKRISNFLSAVVPAMIGFYVVSAFIVIAFNFKNIPESIVVIVESAFNFKAAAGGALGAFIMATTRIVVATEMGLGTAPVMHANSTNPIPAKEGIISMSSPVIDTLFVCLMSVLTIIVTDSYKSGLSGIAMTVAAFKTVAPWFSYMLLVMVPIMGINVVIAWSYYGMKNCQYLFGAASRHVYRILFILCAFGGGIIADFDIVVKFTDVVNTACAIPNIITLFLTSGIIAREYNKYLDDKRKGLVK